VYLTIVEDCRRRWSLRSTAKRENELCSLHFRPANPWVR
jgi:hypothetical protein